MKEPKIRLKGFSGEWEEKKLSHMVCSISSGKDTPSQGKFPLYGSTGIIGTVCNSSYNGPLLLVARVGANAGHIQLVNEECGITDNTLIVCPKAETSLDYLYYFFQQLNLNKLVYGSGQPLITGGMLKNIDVRVGSKDECQLLTIYFQNLDTLIQSTTKKIESLKQVKAASLQSMFPQEGETKPRVRFKGFEGDWEKVTVESICKKSASKYSENSLGESIGKYPIYGASGYIQNIMTYDYDVPYVGIIKDGSGVGRSQLYPAYSSILGTMQYILPKKNIDVSFLSYLFETIDFSSYINGSSIPHIYFKDYCIKEIKLPSNEEQRAIGAYFTNLDTQITLQTQRLEKLKQIKSACLDNMFV